MTEFINKRSGKHFFVDDSRKGEYLAAGHVLAVKPTETPVEAKEKPKAVKKPAKKRG